MQSTTAQITQDAQAVLRKTHKILGIIFLLAVRTLTDFQMQFKFESSISPSCILALFWKMFFSVRQEHLPSI